jgi:hypothetical protein
MEMKRWSTRWKTKRSLWNCSLTTLVTLIVVLQADDARAGKTLRRTAPYGSRRITALIGILERPVGSLSI